MTARPPHLPDFKKPPVVEVALSVRFKALGLRHAHLGLLWAHYRGEFPSIEEQPPLPLTIEEFARGPRAGLQVQLQLGAPPVPRQWFISNDGGRLIQIQADGFMHNWRRTDAAAEYPRFDTVKAGFMKHWASFQQFVAEENLGRIEPVQCEVTYVNLIEAAAGGTSAGQLEGMFPAWSGRFSDAFLPIPEEVRLGAAFVMNDAHGGPIGRLHIAAEPALRPRDNTPVVMLQLAARGAPVGSGEEGVIGFLDLGREWIDRGFASFTSKAMHARWERIQ